MRSLIAKAVVSSKGQVVIPRILRDQLGIHTGNELLFKMRKDGVVEFRRVERSIDMFIGRCKRTHEKPMSIADMDNAIMQAVDEKKGRKNKS